MEQDKPRRRYTAKELLELPKLIEGKKAVDTLLALGLPLQNHSLTGTELAIHPELHKDPDLRELRIGSKDSMDRIVISMPALALAVKWSSTIPGLGNAPSITRVVYPHFAENGDSLPEVETKKGKEFVETTGVKSLQVFHLSEQQFSVLKAEVEAYKSQTAETILAPAGK